MEKCIANQIGLVSRARAAGMIRVSLLLARSSPCDVGNEARGCKNGSFAEKPARNSGTSWNRYQRQLEGVTAVRAVSTIGALSPNALIHDDENTTFVFSLVR